MASAAVMQSDPARQDCQKAQGGKQADPDRLITWEELATHSNPKDAWLAIEGKVYDVSAWSKRHPGGLKVLTSYAGEDASEVFNALHPGGAKKPRAILASLPVMGRIDPKSKQVMNRNEALASDFKELREWAEKEGLFKPNYWFYVLMLAHILALEAAAYFLMRTYGTGWEVYLLCAALLATAQAQAGWLQHDFGHLSVFKSSRLNHWAHYFVICHLKAASSGWWNTRHYRHHAKPNVLHKDPDIGMPYVFVLGKKPAVRWAEKKKGVMPYAIQHRYWHIIGPPLLLPVYFHYDNLDYAIRRRKWVDLLWMASFFAKHFALYGPLLGGWGAFWFYMFFRSLESHWFTYVTQMNHIPMEIDFDPHSDWASIQCNSTCNVEHSWFNDWFTGHLNFQIEHHLFPTMPRHNYYKINQRVTEMFAKHNVPMQTKSLWRAFCDIVNSLEEYGQIWKKARYDI